MTTTTHTRRRVLLALAGVTVLSACLPACTPPPVRRRTDDSANVAPPVSVSPELERAPRRPEPQTRAEPGPQVATTAAADPEPQTTPPPSAAPTPPPIVTTPTTVPDDWWTREPAKEPGRVRIVVSATGETLREARRASVDQGLVELRRVVGDNPRGVRYELTNVQRDAPGTFRGYVLISCDAP